MHLRQAVREWLYHGDNDHYDDPSQTQTQSGAVSPRLQNRRGLASAAEAEATSTLRAGGHDEYDPAGGFPAGSGSGGITGGVDADSKDKRAALRCRWASSSHGGGGNRGSSDDDDDDDDSGINSEERAAERLPEFHSGRSSELSSGRSLELSSERSSLELSPSNNG